MHELLAHLRRILGAKEEDSAGVRVSSTFLWTSMELALSSCVRLISTLILSRLLMPEAFGLMAVANTVMIGLAMFSDLGLNANIIQHPKGDREDFLQTVWTLQVLRGLVLGSIAVVLAGPMATMNGMPELKWMIPALALGSVIGGFRSTYLACYEKRMVIGPRVMWHALTTVAGIALTVLSVWWFRSVAALLVNPLFTHIAQLALSHTLLGGGMRMRFRWDWDQLRETVSFSVWVFLSTGLLFLVNRTDILALGALAGAGTVGVYSYAKNLSAMPLAPVSGLCNRMLLPLYAESLHKGPGVLERRALRVRLGLYAIFLPMAWMLTAFGPHLIRLLYPERYWDAGWMLSVLSAGACCTLVRNSMVSIFLAAGDSFVNFVNQGVRFAIMAVCLLTGYAWYGNAGLVVGFALTDLIYYPVLIVFTRRYGIWCPWMDGAAFLVTGLVSGIALWLNS